MQIYIKPVVLQVALLLFQSAIYFGVQKLEGPAHNIEKPIDEKIPLIPKTVFIYGMWYPLIAVFPLVLWGIDRQLYVAYVISIMVDIILSSVIYMVYPTSFERPKQISQNLSGRILKWIYIKGNYMGKNCMPSMHCSMCFIIIFFVIACGGMDLWIKGPVMILAVLIIISTLLTKQHVLIDVITAFPIAAMCYLIGYGCL